MIQTHAQCALLDTSDYSKSGAAQSIGIARTGWFLADRKKTYKRVDLVGQRYSESYRRLGNAITGACGPIMFRYRIRNAISEPIVAPM